jgi:FMN phosphatase YigB (HAD superfamily)
LKYLVLDAMGVIYSVGDDVKDLLCPFIEEKGGIRDVSRIESLYVSASLGSMSAFEFWEAVNLSPEVEDEYLRRHKLTDGLIGFLEEMKSRDYEVWCLSNDLSEWSRNCGLVSD